MIKKLDTISFDAVSEQKRVKYKTRHAARAVVYDDDGRIALLHVTKHVYHKLPGGGIEKGENEIEALKRECLEEIGCTIELISKDILMVDEYRDKIEMHGFSACYVAKIVGEKGEPKFTEKELGKGFEVTWINPNKAIDILSNDTPDDYEGPYIQQRDMLFLKEILQ